MKQTSKRLTSMILSLVFLLAALLIFFDLIQPAYGDLQTKKGQELSSENFLIQEQQLVDQAKKILSQYEAENQSQDNLVLAMPSGPNVAGALGQIYGIAQNNTLAIQGVNISPATVKSPAPPQGTTAPLTASQIIKPLGTLTFQIIAVGNYESLKSFLGQLETNIRVFDVTTLSTQAAPSVVAIKGQAVNSDLFTFNIAVATYYQLP